MPNDKSVFSSCDVETVDNQNYTHKQLREIRAVYNHKIIVAELNINSKFEELAENITKYVDILLIVETKLDDSFPTNQFHIDGYQQLIVLPTVVVCYFTLLIIY